MAYIKYEVDVNQGMYADYEKLRKENVGDRLVRADAETLIGVCGLPSESSKVFGLTVKHGLLLRFGKAAGTYYMVPKEMVPYARFEDLEKDFYNGSKPKPKPKKPKVEDKETGRVVLDEDYCLKYLKERGYMCFKLRPNLLKLQQVMTPQFLLDNCDAELK